MVGTFVLFVLQLVLVLVLQSIWEYRRLCQQEREEVDIVLDDDVWEDLGLNGVDDTTDGNENGDIDGTQDGGNSGPHSTQEESSLDAFYDARSIQEQQQNNNNNNNNASYDIDMDSDDEAGQWEDLRTTQLGARSTLSEDRDGGNGTGGTTEHPGPRIEEELRHTIPGD